MKIEKCPFCGGEAVPTQEDCLGYYNDTWMVFCSACDLYIGFAKQYTKEQAIVAWNRRAQPENKPLTLDELKQMDGEPIWVVTLEGTDEPRWGIVVSAGKRGIDLICVLNGAPSSKLADFDLYNYTWLAYRNKPVKEEHHETD